MSTFTASSIDNVARALVRWGEAYAKAKNKELEQKLVIERVKIFFKNAHGDQSNSAIRDFKRTWKALEEYDA